MIIGRFKQEAGSYTGDLRTMTLKMDVVIQAVANREVEVGPTHLVYAGAILIGMGFEKRAEDSGRYIALRLDDPLFPVPVDATLRECEGGEWLAEWFRPGTAKFAKVA